MEFSPDQQISPLSALNLALLGQCVIDLEEAWLKSSKECLMGCSPTDRPGSGLGKQTGGERLKIGGAASIFQGLAKMEGLQRTA